MEFDFQPTLHGTGLSLRPMREDDRRALRIAASDPQIWAGHPSSDRYLPEVFDPYFDGLLESQQTLVIVKDSGRLIGCSKFYVAPDGREQVSIGFTFLTRDHWGGRTNFEVKRLMLGHIFETRDEAWFHIGATNIRSQIATSRLGVEEVQSEHLDLGTGAGSWKCYKLTKQAWAAKLAERGGDS